MPAHPENAGYFEHFLAGPWDNQWSTHPLPGEAPLDMVLVEPRNHRYLEGVLRNFSAQIPYASLTILHSDENAPTVRDILATHGGPGNVRCIRMSAGNIDILAYNGLMGSAAFWDIFGPGTDRVLVFQTDTGIRKNRILQYMHYDYIGSPWGSADGPGLPPPHGHVWVGNGGFSLRNPRHMRSIAAEHPYAQQAIVPEDLYFASHLAEAAAAAGAGAPLLPDFDTARGFSCEHHQHPDPMGFHQGYMWHDAPYVHDVLLSMDRCETSLAVRPAPPYSAWVADGAGRILAAPPVVLPWVRLGVGVHGLQVPPGSRVPGGKAGATLCIEQTPGAPPMEIPLGPHGEVVEK